MIILSFSLYCLSGTARSFSVPTQSFLPYTDSVPSLSLCLYRYTVSVSSLYLCPHIVTLSLYCKSVCTLSPCPYTVSLLSVPILSLRHCTVFLSQHNLSCPTLILSLCPYTVSVSSLSLCPHTVSLSLYRISVCTLFIVYTLSLCPYTVSLALHCLFLSVPYQSCPT